MNSAAASAEMVDLVFTRTCARTANRRAPRRSNTFQPPSSSDEAFAILYSLLYTSTHKRLEEIEKKIAIAEEQKGLDMLRKLFCR